MNIIKIQDMLRGVPDNALIGYVQNPQGEVPSYLALSELQRRKDTRAKYQQNQAPESSVAEDLEQETTQDQGGLAMLAGQPQQDMAEQGVASLDTGDMYKEDSFAAGGIVAFEEGGYTSRDRLADAPRILRGDIVKENDPWYSRIARNYNRLFDLSGTVRDPLIKQMQRENVAKTPFNPFLLGEYDVKTYDEYTGLKEKARQMKADQKDYDRMKELEAQFKASQEKIPTGGGATKESIAAMQAAEKKQAEEEAKKNPYKPLSDKEKEAIKKQFNYVDDKSSTSKGNAPAQQPAESDEDYLRKRMALYKEFMGPNEDRTKLQEKIDKMEARAARQEEMAPWMALTEAGFKTMAGTSPFALTNIGAGAEAGIKSYGAAQDKLASLEEKRYALMNEAAKADRAEKQAIVKFGFDSEEAKANRDQKERLGQAELDLRREANRLSKEYNIARLNAVTDKGLLKSQAEQMIKVNKGIDEQLAYLASAPKSEKITAMINNLKAQKAQNEAHVKSIYANLKNPGLAGTETSASNTDPLGIL